MSDLKRLVERAGQRSQAVGGPDGGGSVVLLRAPRAGFGKSHLLARLAGEMGDRAFVVSVPFDREREVQWSALLWQVLQTFHNSRERDLTLLDLVTRRLFAMVNQRMIINGHVPCAHPAEALKALESRFVELFDFANPEQPVARWFSEHFERLVPFASGAAGKLSGLSGEAAAHWLRVLCSYSQGRPEGDVVRWEALRWSVLQPSGPSLAHGGMSMVSAGSTGEAGARERVVEFCRLAAGVRPLVLVFDELDLFHQQSEPVQRIAGFIAELRRLLSRAVHVLSVNQDLWTQTFQRSLPSAIEDRLTGNQITLGTITRDDAARMIRDRLRHAGLADPVADGFLHRLNLSAYFSQEAGRLVSPRAVLRHAAAVWDEFERTAAHEPPPVNGRVAPVPQIPDIPTVSLKVADAPYFRTGPMPSRRDPEPEPEPDYEDEEPIRAVSGEDPAFARLRDTLQRLLTPLRSDEPEPAHEPFVIVPEPTPVSGAILADPKSVPLPEAAPACEPPVSPPHSAATLVHRRFQQLRAHFLTAPWLGVDQDRLFHLLKEGGRRLAVVRWQDHSLAGSPGQSAGAWLSPDGETIIGSEPYEDRTYWSALVHFVRKRSGHGFGSRGRQERPCRLAVFSAVKAPVNLVAWMPQDEIIDARTHFLDVHSMDQPVLATLYAADEMMRDAERGALGVTPAETFTLLMPQLEFLWKLMTRPLAVK